MHGTRRHACYIASITHAWLTLTAMWRCLFSLMLQTKRRVENEQQLVELGPIGISVGKNRGADEDSEGPTEPVPSIHSMTTAEWRARYENADGTIDLWVEEEFNAGSRLVVSGGVDC